MLLAIFSHDLTRVVTCRRNIPGSWMNGLINLIGATSSGEGEHPRQSFMASLFGGMTGLEINELGIDMIGRISVRKDIIDSSKETNIFVMAYRLRPGQDDTLSGEYVTIQNMRWMELDRLPLPNTIMVGDLNWLIPLCLEQYNPSTPIKGNPAFNAAFEVPKKKDNE